MYPVFYNYKFKLWINNYQVLGIHGFFPTHFHPTHFPFPPPQLGCPRKLGSMVSKLVIYITYLLNGVFLLAGITHWSSLPGTSKPPKAEVPTKPPRGFWARIVSLGRKEGAPWPINWRPGTHRGTLVDRCRWVGGLQGFPGFSPGYRRKGKEMMIQGSKMFIFQGVLCF